MAKSVNPLVHDAALDMIGACTRVYITDTEVTVYANLAAASLIGTHTIVGSFTKSTNGGREIATPAQADVPITGDGNANHVTLVDASNNIIVTTTTTSAQGLSSGGTVTIPSFVYRCADPV